MKTYFKTFAKMFKRHLTRLVSVFLMVLVSAGFTSGIGMSTEKMAYSLSDYYHAQNVSDFIVRGSSAISDEEIGEIAEKLGPAVGEEDLARGGVIELVNGELGMNGATVKLTGEGVGEGVTRIYLRESDDVQNAAEVRQSAPPQQDETPQDKVFSATFEHANKDLAGVPLGTDLKLTLSMGPVPSDYMLRITDEVVGPLHFAEYDDPSMTEQEDGEYALLENVLYVSVDDAHTLPFPMNELYISSPVLKQRTLFSPEYERELSAEKAAIEEVFSDEIEAGNAAVLTLHENFSFESFLQYQDKIDGIGIVLMVVFLLVTLLVVLSTMTRLLDEERAQIACLRTLGYSPMRILSKYLLFAFVGMLIGSVGAYFAGEGLSYIIYINFSWNYVLPAYSSHAAPLFFILSCALVLITTLAATLISGMRMMRESPASLLHPKAPKAGRKVIIERIPILWNRFSFKYKSTLRNVLRFRTRFIMTVVAVMASTALVLAGLAVLDCCLFQNIGTAAMLGVGVIVVLFAALLNAVVIYTLTNINISERNRELATLMVLGYHDKEVTSYVYREIYITSSIGILLGVPFGCLLCLFVFHMMSFGSLAGISWFVWILAPLLSLLFTFLVTLMLRRKILRIDMNESLKAIE